MPSVLLIDDNPHLRDLLGEGLEASGCEVDKCRTGEDGIERYRNHPSDLVVVDLMLPGMNGVQVIEWLRENYGQKVRIIAISGGLHDFPPVERVQGANRTMSKPFHVDDLVSVAMALLT